jgi:1,4-alpha-glucan branching enzyme
VELMNTDASAYGGSGIGNMGRIHTEQFGWDGQEASATLTLPPLSVVWFTPG